MCTHHLEETQVCQSPQCGGQQQQGNQVYMNKNPKSLNNNSRAKSTLSCPD